MGSAEPTRLLPLASPTLNGLSGFPTRVAGYHRPVLLCRRIVDIAEDLTAWNAAGCPDPVRFGFLVLLLSPPEFTRDS